MKKRWLILISVLALSLTLTGTVLATARAGAPRRAAAQAPSSAADTERSAPASPQAAASPAVLSILEEHFDGPFPPPGWTVVNHSGDCTWTDESGEAAPEGNLTPGRGGFADADSDSCGSGSTMDTSLVSPVFDLSNAAPSTALEFASDYKHWSNQIASVEISNSVLLTWTTVWSTSGNTVNEFVHVDLSDFVGYPDNQVRFHFKAPEWDYWWQIDDVIIAEPGNDLSLFHEAPAFTPYGTPVPYTITLFNNAPTTTTVLPLSIPMLGNETYLSDTLSCAGGFGTCIYDSGLQRVLWSGWLTPTGSVELHFLLSNTASTPCDFMPSLVTVEDTYGPVLQESFGVEVRQAVYQHYDFEASNGGFNAAGDWGWGTPDPASAPRGPASAYNGWNLWGTNLTGPYAGSSVMSRTLDLTSIPPTPVGVTLLWKHWLDLAPGDLFNVYINNDLLLSVNNLYLQREWDFGGFDISPYLGQVVMLTFELQANGASSAAPHTGVYIDSLAVVDNCPYIDADWKEYQEVCPGDIAEYPIFNVNHTYTTQTLSMSLSGNNWLTTLSNNNFPINPGEYSLITVTVQTPLTAAMGSIDKVLVQELLSPYYALPFSFTLTTYAGPHWVPDTSAPQPAADGAAVSYNNDAYYFPGGITETFLYTPALHSWLPLAPEPTPAYASGDACYGNDAGGNPVVVLFPNTASASPDLHLYHILTDSWSVLPMGAGGAYYPPRDHIAIASDTANNLCYISGGIDTGGIVTNTLEIYDPASNALTLLPPMSTPRAYHASWVDSSGRICVAGGITNVPAPPESTQCYSPTAGAWEAENATYGHLPAPHWGMAEVQTSGDEVWLLGGSYDYYYYATQPTLASYDTFIWDTGLLTWTKGITLPLPLTRSSAVIADGEMYLFGGIETRLSGGPISEYLADTNLLLNTCQTPTSTLSADIWLQKYADPPVAAVGVPFTYTFAVGNDGPGTVNNLIIEDYLPTQVSVTLPGDASCVSGGSGFTCTLGTSLLPGDVAYFSFQATGILSGSVINQAAAIGDVPDPDISNNVAAAESYFTPQPIDAPLIFDLTPTQGINTQATVITVTGMNFNPGLTVTLGSTPLSHTRTNSRQIQAVVPAGLAPGSYDVGVTNPDGQSDVAVQAFTVYADAAPVLYGIFPEEATNDLPVGMIIVGENFVPDTVAILSSSLPIKGNAPFTVTLSGNYFVNGNILFSIVPQNLPPATYDLVVVTPNGHTAILPQAYTVIDANAIDLYGSTGDLWTDPHTVRSGDTITVGATVRRSGGLSTTLSNVEVAFFLGDPASSAAIPLGSGNTGPIPPRDPGTAEISLDLSSLPPGYYDLFAVIDPNDTVSELDEGNNVLTRTLAVLPAAADTQPPNIVDFRVDNGAQSTSDVQVSLALSATDNVAPVHMFNIEYTYLPALGFWWPVRISGWQPYQQTTNAALYTTPGIHYLLAWVADAAGNVSDPAMTWINLMQPATPIAEGEIHPYRLRMHAGETVRVRLNSGTGDADLYVFGPDDSLIGRSTNSTPVDEVSFTAAQDGVYQIEVEGYAASSTYTLEVLPGSATLTSPGTSSASIPKSPLRHVRGLPILSVGETPSGNTGLEEVPDTLYIINLPLILR